MALPFQQIQEQEAPILQRKSADIHAITEKTRGYRKCYIEFDDLERYNKPKNATAITSVLGALAKILLSVIIQKLKKDEYFPVTHTYLSKTTRRKERQNLYIIDELRDIFNIEYKRKFKFKGKIYLRCFVFSLKKTEDPNLQNDAKNIPLQTAEVYSIDEPLKNNSSERTRSNGDLISLKNSDSETQNTNKENGNIEKESFQQDEVDERDASNKNTGYVGRNGFLGKAKGLNEMKSYLTDLLCSELRSKSGREFSNKAISEILQNIANKGYEVFFMHINGFIRYMTDALKGEKRDAVQTSNDNFYIKANKKPEELIEHREQAEMHYYLNQVEQDSITNRSDENQFKARIANSFSPRTAYILLKNLSFIREAEEVLELYLASRCSLTPSEETRLLWQAQSIGGYADTLKLKFITSS